MRGKPGMLQSTGSQRVRHDLATEQKQYIYIYIYIYIFKIIFHYRLLEHILLSEYSFRYPGNISQVD